MKVLLALLLLEPLYPAVRFKDPKIRSERCSSLLREFAHIFVQQIFRYLKQLLRQHFCFWLKISVSLSFHVIFNYSEWSAEPNSVQQLYKRLVATHPCHHKCQQHSGIRDLLLGCRHVFFFNLLVWFAFNPAYILSEDEPFNIL